MQTVKPYHKLDLWKDIIDWQLLLIVILAIMSLISLKLKGDALLIDILINIGCSVVVSIALSIFIYFKYLKKIPDENREKINELLNTRLNHETGNHNAVLSSLNPNNAHLSKEHDRILSTVTNINNSIIQYESDTKNKYHSLASDQRVIVDSINNLNGLSAMLQQLKQENDNLARENSLLRHENTLLKQQTRTRSRSREHELEL